jgi:hypothetical protein
VSCGRCVEGDLAPAPPPPADKSECDKLAAEAHASIAAAQAKAASSCAHDDDCTIVSTAACPPGCEVAAVAKSSERSLGEAVARMGIGPCAEWSNRDCARTTGAPVPSCAPHTAVCANGACSAKPPP